VSLRRNKQGGFSVVESILIVAAIVVLGYVIYHFGWGMPTAAGERLLKTDIGTIEKAVGMYVLNSNGLYPTDDGKLPPEGEYKWLLWDASYTKGGKQISFYPVVLARLPRHWDEGVWRIDSVGRVSVTVNPKDY
jgi:hypothetical protein